jgi:hypothetical protein
VARARAAGFAFIVLLVALTFAQASAQVVTKNPVLATEADADEAGNPLVSEVYTMTVPPKPTVCCQGGFEFHVGVMTSDGSLFVESTFSYGCQVALHKGCQQPYLDRYIFYLTAIDAETGARTEYPSPGVVVTSASAYTVTLTVTAVCPSTTSPSVTVTLANSTSTFSLKVCSLGAMIYDKASAGILEQHVTKCSQMSPSDSVLQGDITWNGVPIPGSAWINRATAPSIGCHWGLEFSDSGVRISWLAQSAPTRRG